MRILITGGAGFVGSSLALKLKAHYDSASVLALDNLKRRGSELNLARFKKAGIEFVHGDVRCMADLNECGTPDLLIDCAAEPSVLSGVGESPQYVIDTNLGGTINCLELARRAGSNIIFLSTSRVYPIGIIEQLNYHETETRFELAEHQNTNGVSIQGFSEELTTVGERSIYGASKLCSELLLHEYINTYNIRGIINRCGVITGPWQMGKVDQGVVVLWIARHIFNQPLSFIGYGGHGKQVRDILHIDDLFELVRYQIDHIEELNGQTFNVGGGRSISVSLLELTQLCQKITGKSVPINRIQHNRPNDLRLYLSDCTKVGQMCAWQPSRGCESIVEEIARWITDNRSVLQPILGG